jgi:hypothetical protein
LCYVNSYDNFFFRVHTGEYYNTVQLAAHENVSLETGFYVHVLAKLSIVTDAKADVVDRHYFDLKMSLLNED